jgi:predicted ATPase/DNA-binding winged helix-turn-helix (wHTH) protein
MGDLRFGPFELREGQRQLLRDGRAVTLGARAFDVLLTLAAQRGRAVSKDDLFAAVWPGQVVEENNLAVQVSALRKVLGADVIATVAGRGYQFTAATTAADKPAPPLGTTTLHGRDAVLQTLSDALARHPLVTVLGTAGVGKTAIARALVALRADGGAVTVELAGVEPQRGGDLSATTTAVATAVAAALALPLSARSPLDRLLQHLRQLPAAERPALVVLDNCEHLADGVAELVSLMHGAAPGLPLLATSQVPLRLPIEHTVRLEPLDLPAGGGLEAGARSSAVSLFVARAAALVPGFALVAENVDQVLEICRRLEGIPLAIELAAARVPLLGTAGLLHRLDERMRLLARAPNAETQAHQPQPLQRHRALRAALDWSYSLLPPAEQTLLRRLALFSGGFTASSAQQLAGDATLDEWAVLDGLGALVEKSLVVAPGGAGNKPTEPRFSLLETVRDYAREQLRAAGEGEALARRHAELFETLAQAHGGALGGEQAGTRRARLETEHDNLRAALTWATDHDTALGLRLAAASMPFWRERGHHAEALQRCDRLLERSSDADAALRLPVQLRMAMLGQEMGDAARVEQCATAALASARACSNARGEANAHAVLAHAAVLRGEPVLALQRHRDALATYRTIGDPKLVAEGLNNVASGLCELGRPDEAEPLLDEALPLVRNVGYAWLEAAILHTKSEVACARGDYTTARGLLELSLLLRRTLQHKFHLVMGLRALAVVALLLKRDDDAADELREALSLCSSHDFADEASKCLLAAAAWAAAAQRGHGAARLLGHLDTALEGNPDALGRTEAALHREATDRTQTLLGITALARSRAEGRALPREAALREALALLDAAPG